MVHLGQDLHPCIPRCWSRRAGNRAAARNSPRSPRARALHHPRGPAPPATTASRPPTGSSRTRAKRWRRQSPRASTGPSSSDPIRVAFPPIGVSITKAAVECRAVGSDPVAEQALLARNGDEDRDRQQERRLDSSRRRRARRHPRERPARPAPRSRPRRRPARGPCGGARPASRRPPPQARKRPATGLARGSAAARPIAVRRYPRCAASTAPSATATPRAKVRRPVNRLIEAPAANQTTAETCALAPLPVGDRREQHGGRQG